MSIMNNRISIYCNKDLGTLCNYIDKEYFDDCVFLSVKFYHNFKDNFNCTYYEFVDYIEENNIFTPYLIVCEFFYFRSRELWQTL